MKRVRILAKSQARTLVWSLALMTVIVLVATAVFFGVTAALAYLTFILALTTWRESRIAKREKESVQMRIEKLSRERGSVIEVLCNALGLEENVTSSQAHRVAEMASAVAWQLGLREDAVAAVRQAAILHDVGKVGIAESVLSKTDNLTDGEWEKMMRHPEVGHEILAEVPSLRAVAEVVRSHHERFDGQGYPQGLKGDEIPVASRIYAVVDAYAAMTTERPYRKKMAHDMAVREIVRNSLTQFDPAVVEAFLASVQSEDLPTHPSGRMDWPAERAVASEV
jgi:HD-GYP domain-containing protein (c-di-GMP phosphodiesterase class II)